MPYVARKEGGKYTVYKKKKDGKPGEKVGSTKGTKEALKKYMAALHMHESETLKTETTIMKKSELRAIIREEISKVIKEANISKGFAKAAEALKKIELEMQSVVKEFSAEKDLKKKEAIKAKLKDLTAKKKAAEIEFNIALKKEPIEDMED